MFPFTLSDGKLAFSLNLSQVITCHEWASYLNLSRVSTTHRCPQFIESQIAGYLITNIVAPFSFTKKINFEFSLHRLFIHSSSCVARPFRYVKVMVLSLRVAQIPPFLATGLPIYKKLFFSSCVKVVQASVTNAIKIVESRFVSSTRCRTMTSQTHEDRQGVRRRKAARVSLRLVNATVYHRLEALAYNSDSCAELPRCTEDDVRMKCVNFRYANDKQVLS